MKATVCIITTVHPPFDTRIFHKQAKTLVKAGYDVILIAQHDKNEIVDGVKIIALPRPQNRFQRMLELDFKAFQFGLRQKADIYHFHDPEFLLWGWLLRVITKAKVVYDVHEDYPKAILSRYWLPKPLRRPIASLFDILEKLLAKQFDCIITATDHIKTNFRGANTISVKNYPLRDDLSLKDGNREGQQDCYILIYAGSLSGEYGVKEMVQALEFLDIDRNVSLRLLGKFNEKKFEQEIRRLPGYKKAEYLGWCNRDEVLKNMMEADIGLTYDHPLPRFKVGISTKLLEYMSVGLPVITPNYPLWKEIVEGNDCGIVVEPLNPKALAKAIEYLLKNPELRKMMGENGRRAFLENYNWETESRKFLDVYSKLLGGDDV